ncbi:MAG: hypothetical protein CML01_20150, partial [Pseudomonas sp.]|nr:hypothetical protein [Pseudomonas sp.]
MSILVLADHHDGQLAGTTAHVVAAAQEIAKAGGGDIDVLVAGEGVSAIADAAAQLDGVSAGGTNDWFNGATNRES